MKVALVLIVIFLVDIGESIISQHPVESINTVGQESSNNKIYKSAVRAAGRLWTHGVVPYEMTTDFTREERQLIGQAMEEFHKHTCIKFTPRDNGHTKEYILIQKDKSRCNSKIGMSAPKQPVKLSSGCLTSVVKIMHELMHVIGFYHEHSRYDRDKHVQIHRDNIKKGFHKNFNKISPESSLLLGTRYDHDSIMHYGLHDFAINRKRPTISRIGGFTTPSKQHGFSQTDILRINRLYQCNKDDTCWDDDIEECSRLLGEQGLSFCLLTDERLVTERCRKSCGFCKQNF